MNVAANQTKDSTERREPCANAQRHLAHLPHIYTFQRNPKLLQCPGWQPHTESRREPLPGALAEPLSRNNLFADSGGTHIRTDICGRVGCEPDGDGTHAHGYDPRCDACNPECTCSPQAETPCERADCIILDKPVSA